MDGCVLNIRCEDCRMLAQVDLECVTGPATNGLHDIERDAAKHIFKNTAHTDAMALQRPNTSSSSCPQDAFEKFRTGERAKRAC